MSKSQSKDKAEENKNSFGTSSKPSVQSPKEESKEESKAAPKDVSAIGFIPGSSTLRAIPPPNTPYDGSYYQPGRPQPKSAMALELEGRTPTIIKNSIIHDPSYFEPKYSVKIIERAYDPYLNEPHAGLSDYVK